MMHTEDHRKLAESSLDNAHQKINGLEKQMEDLRGDLVQAKDELSRERASYADKLSEVQKEMAQLAGDLATSRHDFGAKSAELNAKTIEADNLQVMLVEAQRTIERLTEDNKRLESELLAKGKLEEDMAVLKEELEGLRKELDSNNAMFEWFNLMFVSTKDSRSFCSSSSSSDLPLSAAA